MSLRHVVCSWLVLMCAFVRPVWGGAPGVELVMGSWRTEDIAAMRTLLDMFTEEYPHIRVIFDPTPAADYDAVLKAQLEGGTAPDVMYLRSFTVSRQLFAQGFLEPLDDLPGLHQHFDAGVLEAWSEHGQVYGVPMIATAHGIYYNKDIFARLGLVVPTTWEQLLSAAYVIQQAGIVPFANASGEPWTINEIVFYNIAPNFLGGYPGRREYLTGKRCFDDAAMVGAFQAVADLRPFLPPNQHLLLYTDSLHLFTQGQAAMWFGGSWDIPFFEQEALPFAWDVFAPPPPAGSSPRMTFHLDAGVGVNAKSRHKEAARTLLAWMVRPEFGRLMGNELPGFFPMHTHAPSLANTHADAVLRLVRERETDVRFVWDQLREGTPSGYDLTQEAACAVLNGRMTPVQAAKHLQIGLARWFRPAMSCGLRE